MIIREATVKDSSKIIDFQQKMALETEGVALNLDVVTAGVGNVFRDSSRGKYFVAVEDDQVIGCLMTTFEWSEWRNGTILWIQSVYIDPLHRGKGVYRKLYEYVRQMVEGSSQYKGIRLYVDKSNKKAQEVYEKLGMNGEHYQVFEWMKPN